MPETKTKEKSVASTTKKKGTSAEDKKRANGLRLGAVICWLVAIAFEVLGFLMYLDKITISFLPTLAGIIAVIVLDLIFVIIGSQLWKKANHIDPASEKNKVKFFLWNNMGVIVCIIAFVPYIILILTDKQNKLDKKTKAIAVVVAVIALLIGSVSSVDWDPISSEQKEEAITVIGEDATVYYTPFGHVYHTSKECQHINRSDNISETSVKEAIDNGRTRLCKTCAARDNIEGVATNE